MSVLLHIADRVLNRPLLITPDKAAVIMSVLAGRIGIDAAGMAPEASRFVGDGHAMDDQGRARRLPYRRTAEGVGIITITGSLVNRGAFVGASSGLTSYEGIKFQLSEAGKDAKVNSVILDLQSPGGEAVGAFEAAQAVRELAAIKPVIAVVNGMAASAAYALASGATRIVTTPTGVVGSIGVVMMHADYSRMLANEGIVPTLIHAGDHKVDGNPFEALSPEVKADIQAEIDAFYEQFLQTVAAGRGSRTSIEDARATQARTFIGAAAVKAKLADSVGTFEQVLAELSRAPQGRTNSQVKGNHMSENTGAPAAETAGITKADLDAAVATARAEGAANAKAEHDAKTTADAARMAAITSADGIKGNAARLAAATDLAAKAPDMSAADVTAFVVASVPAAQSFESRMAQNPANGLGASGGGAQPTASSWDRAHARVGLKTA